jgi:hypothetical protein
MSKLNRSVRHLVLNRTNQAVAPRDENLPGFEPAALKAAGEIRKKFSPSIKSESVAKAFGAALASKYPGERFYLAKIVAGCMVEQGPWVATGTALADEHVASEECDDDSDGDLGDTDNE